MKPLIAAACIAVILGVGYFIAMDRTDRATERNRAERLAYATFCRDLLHQTERYGPNGFDLPAKFTQEGKQSPWEIAATNCVLNGAFTADDMERAAARFRAN